MALLGGNEGSSAPGGSYSTPPVWGGGVGWGEADVHGLQVDRGLLPDPGPRDPGLVTEAEV